MTESAPWVVIPTYNEKDNIAALISSLCSLPIERLQILVVDDSSPDGTASIVRELIKTRPNVHVLVREKKDGLGQAYIHGFQHALEQGAGAVVQMDADFSHDPNDIPRLLEKLTQADLVIGSRYSQGISVVNWPLRRLLISIAGNLYVRLLTGLPLKDVTGGFRAWKAAALQSINLSSIAANGYAFQIITVWRTWKTGRPIVEVPITFTERREGQSKMSNAIILEAIWVVWRLRLLKH